MKASLLILIALATLGGPASPALAAERPKIYPHLAAMKLNVATALGLDVRKVGIKATTNERLGFVGREEGIAAMAVAAVDLPE